MNVADYLAKRNVSFEMVEHRPAYCASKLAEATHTRGYEVAKTVLLKTPDGFVIAVVPSTRFVDLPAIEGLLGVHSVRLATEDEATATFPDLEPGVVPPFGSGYGIRTVVDIHLAVCPRILFEGATHHEAIRMSFKDYQMLECPIAGLISRQGCEGPNYSEHELAAQG